MMGGWRGGLGGDRITMGVGANQEEGGRGKEEAMTHISDPDPSGLLLTLVTPSRVCVCATGHQ